MLSTLRNVLFAVALLAVACPHQAEARITRTQMPLCGCRGYTAAKGSVTCVESVGEPGRNDGTTLVIEVGNVPLPPGTELLVFVDDAQVGALKLDKNQNGRLVLETKFRKPAPKIKVGSFVVLKLDDGSTVVW